MWRINNQFGIEVNALRKQAMNESSSKCFKQSHEYTFIEVNDEEQDDKQTSNGVPSSDALSNNNAEKKRPGNSTLAISLLKEDVTLVGIDFAWKRSESDISIGFNVYCIQLFTHTCVRRFLIWYNPSNSSFILILCF